LCSTGGYHHAQATHPTHTHTRYCCARLNTWHQASRCCCSSYWCAARRTHPPRCQSQAPPPWCCCD
jgi:hypothetical protein